MKFIPCEGQVRSGRSRQKLVHATSPFSLSSYLPAPIRLLFLKSPKISWIHLLSRKKATVMQMMQISFWDEIPMFDNCSFLGRLVVGFHLGREREGGRGVKHNAAAAYCAENLSRPRILLGGPRKVSPVWNGFKFVINPLVDTSR